MKIDLNLGELGRIGAILFAFSDANWFCLRDLFRYRIEVEFDVVRHCGGIDETTTFIGVYDTNGTLVKTFYGESKLQ